MTLDLMPGSYAICRLPADAPIPAWATRGGWSSLTRTPNELSIVCASDEVPADVEAQRGYRGLTVRGPLDFSLVGIVAGLANVMAAAAISIFVISTHDTDYLFVRGADVDRAVDALRDAGHVVTDLSSSSRALSAGMGPCRSAAAGSMRPAPLPQRRTPNRSGGADRQSGDRNNRRSRATGC